MEWLGLEQNQLSEMSANEQQLFALGKVYLHAIAAAIDRENSNLMLKLHIKHIQGIGQELS